MKNDINIDSFIIGFVFGMIIGILAYSCFEGERNEDIHKRSDHRNDGLSKKI